MTRIEKCERCKAEWDPGPSNTKILYCFVCKGYYCLKCWGIQRQEEVDTGKYKPLPDHFQGLARTLRFAKK